MFFAKINRKDIVTAHGLQSKDIASVARVLGEKWQNMSEEERDPYMKLFDKDKVRYAEQMKQWRSTQPQKIKLPSSAYAYFVSFIRSHIVETNSSLTFSEIGKELGRRWKMIDATGRLKFQKLADADKLRWLREVRHKDDSDDNNKSR